MKAAQTQPVHPFFPAVSPVRAAPRLRTLLSAVLVWRANTGDGAARPYPGCAWCDETERDLSLDVMTGRRPRS